MLFKDVVGQDESKALLRQYVREARVPHALLFSGREGSGALPLALAFAQYMACPNRGPEDACGECPTCRKMSRLMHADLHFCVPLISGREAGDPAQVVSETMGLLRELLGESGYFSEMEWYARQGDSTKQGSISAAASARVLDTLWLKSFELPYKFMVVWLPERMHPVAANRLLKIVEEPPEGTVFLFASSHPELVLPTIMSRVQQVLLPPVAETAIEGALRARVGLEASRAHSIARAACGSYTAALDLVEAGGETTYLPLLEDLYRCATGRQYAALIEWVARVEQLGREQQKAMLRYFARMLRELYVLNLGQEALCHLLDDELAFARGMCPYIDGRNVGWLLDEYTETLAQVTRNGNARIVFTDFAMRHCRMLPQVSL